jgi:uncharacterized protein involved in exopolysaccharide biosynthesis
MLLSLVGGALFLYTAKSIYTASATVMLEARKSPFSDSILGNSTAPDSVWIESQIMVLKSQPVAAYVVKQLRLADDQQFLRSQNGYLIGFWRVWDGETRASITGRAGGRRGSGGYGRT